MIRAAPREGRQRSGAVPNQQPAEQPPRPAAGHRSSARPAPRVGAHRGHVDQQMCAGRRVQAMTRHFDDDARRSAPASRNCGRAAQREAGSPQRPGSAPPSSATRNCMTRSASVAGRLAVAASSARPCRSRRAERIEARPGRARARWAAARPARRQRPAAVAAQTAFGAFSLEHQRREQGGDDRAGELDRGRARRAASPSRPGRSRWWRARTAAPRPSCSPGRRQHGSPCGPRRSADDDRAGRPRPQL